jgi:hypothetical protein
MMVEAQTALHFLFDYVLAKYYYILKILQLIANHKTIYNENSAYVFLILFVCSGLNTSDVYMFSCLRYMYIYPAVFIFAVFHLIHNIFVDYIVHGHLVTDFA